MLMYFNYFLIVSSVFFKIGSIIVVFRKFNINIKYAVGY